MVAIWRRKGEPSVATRQWDQGGRWRISDRAGSYRFLSFGVKMCYKPALYIRKTRADVTKQLPLRERWNCRQLERLLDMFSPSAVSELRGLCLQITSPCAFIASHSVMFSIHCASPHDTAQAPQTYFAPTVSVNMSLYFPVCVFIKCAVSPCRSLNFHFYLICPLTEHNIFKSNVGNLYKIQLYGQRYCSKS